MTCFEGKKQVHIRIIISSIKANSYKKKWQISNNHFVPWLILILKP